MTHEERARRYLEASRAASVAGRGSEAEAIHHETMRRLEREHPAVREHALVGTSQDFDQPLGRNETEHQRELRRKAGITNTQAASSRRELRAADYRRRAPASPAVPPRRRGWRGNQPSWGWRRRQRARRASSSASAPHRRARRTSSPRSTRRIGRRVISAAPGPVKETGSIFGELFIAGIALSLLYLLLRSEGGEGWPVASITANGITGALRRLTSPTNNLFEGPAPQSNAVEALRYGHVASSVKSRPVPVTALGRRVTVTPTLTGQLHG
jgi:hypothetical protein